MATKYRGTLEFILASVSHLENNHRHELLNAGGFSWLSTPLYHLYKEK
jgi:hypothetical protein